MTARTYNTPRTDSVIAKVMAAHPGTDPRAQANYFEAVHQEIAPLCRELEREVQLLKAELAARQAPEGWISVERRLPEDETPTWEETFQAFRYWDDPTNDGQVWDWDSITHWMPLPQPPLAAAASAQDKKGDHADQA